MDFLAKALKTLKSENDFWSLYCQSFLTCLESNTLQTGRFLQLHRPCGFASTGCLFHHFDLSVLISHAEWSLHIFFPSQTCFEATSSSSPLQFVVCKAAMIEGSEVLNYSAAVSALTDAKQQHPSTNITAHEMMLRSIQFLHISTISPEI